MKQFILVFVGGGLGSMLRFWVSKQLNPYFSNFYIGTFTVNCVGCLLIGILMGLSMKNNLLTPNQTLLATTGFCGGFTTFSTYALESHTLLKDISIPHFALYTFSSIAIGILAIAIGFWLSKLL